MDNLRDRFIEFMCEVGLINPSNLKREIFILKRRYSILQKEAADKGENYSEDDDRIYEFFLEVTKSILVDFFDERSEEVTQGILDRWVQKHEELEDKRKEDTKLNARIIGLTFEKMINQAKRSAFEKLKMNLKLAKEDKISTEMNEEREKRIVAEASLSALQVELKEALEKIAKFERKEHRRIERKKRNHRKKREQVSFYIFNYS